MKPHLSLLHGTIPGRHSSVQHRAQCYVETVPSSGQILCPVQCIVKKLSPVLVEALVKSNLQLSSSPTCSSRQVQLTALVKSTYSSRQVQLAALVKSNLQLSSSPTCNSRQVQLTALVKSNFQLSSSPTSSSRQVQLAALVKSNLQLSSSPTCSLRLVRLQSDEVPFVKCNIIVAMVLLTVDTTPSPPPSPPPPPPRPTPPAPPTTLAVPPLPPPSLTPSGTTDMRLFPFQTTKCCYMY
nr:cdc42 effector protein 1-like [Procambarus clarkii]